jgi:hypothetical protein
MLDIYNTLMLVMVTETTADKFNARCNFNWQPDICTQIV